MSYRTISGICAISALGFLVIADAVYSQDSTPTGWLHRGNQPQSYEMMVDTTVKHSGTASARIRFIGQQAQGFGTLMQMFKADEFRGKRLRVSAWMKTEKADAAQLWMRMDLFCGQHRIDSRAPRALALGPSLSQFAERKFHNSTDQCLHHLKMLPSVAAWELQHEILCAVMQEE